jgi:hypothetical protein
MFAINFFLRYFWPQLCETIYTYVTGIPPICGFCIKISMLIVRGVLFYGSILSLYKEF